jgi:TonB family protein
LTRCLEAAIKSGSKLPPEIILSFTIGPDGQVAGEKVVQTALGHQSLEKCLSQAVRAIQFPGPGPQAAQVTVKLVLEVN